LIFVSIGILTDGLQCADPKEVVMHQQTSTETHLSLWNKHRYRVVLGAGSQGIARGAFDSELVPHSDQVVALVELNLVGDETRAVLLIGRIL
jgi:hypothetical protein